MLNALLARAQRACCAEVAALGSGAVPIGELEDRFVQMFEQEWRASGRAGRPPRIAIVDDAPAQQFLYPEFLLFAQLFRRHGIDAVVRAPEELVFEDGALHDAQGRIDLVYNRLTDFYLEGSLSAPLRAAYLTGAAVVTPNPRAHALYADKRNLVLLTEPARLAALGVSGSTIEILRRGIARTEAVSPSDAERLWAARRTLFFKPAAGHGSKAAYRGEKITRRVWSEVLAGSYVAQELVLPSERHTSAETRMKLDVRNYVYAGDVQLLAARLYQGQTTNMRTPGGGFAPVLTAEKSSSLQELVEM